MTHTLWSSGEFLLAEDHALIAEVVTQLGVDYAQGYRVHHPEPIEDFQFVECGIQRPGANDAHI